MITKVKQELSLVNTWMEDCSSVVNPWTHTVEVWSNVEDVWLLLMLAGADYFCFILLTHKGSHREEVYRDFQPRHDIVRGSGAKGCFRPQRVL